MFFTPGQHYPNTMLVGLVVGRAKESEEYQLGQKYIICFINGAISQLSMAVQGFVGAIPTFVLGFILESALIRAT
jgi:hypothetical protein